VREAGSYSRLSLIAAWRVENAHLFDRYAVERAAIAGYASRVSRSGGVLPRVAPRPELLAATGRLEEKRLTSAVNEAYLLHGTRAETVLPIVRGGLNERFCGGHFGDGCYLAEVADKINQYVVKESRSDPSAVALLHRQLYPGGAPPKTTPPGQAGGGQAGGGTDSNVYYGFVCRAVLGHFVRTRDGQTSLDCSEGGKPLPLFSRGARARELAPIPDGLGGGELFHSMLVEIGGKLKRHREFVLFHSERIYPEYLMAFTRAP